VLASWTVAKWICKRMEIPLRESPIAPLADLQGIVDKPESELPSFTASILPVVLPIVLISLASTFIAIQGKGFTNASLVSANEMMETLKTMDAPAIVKVRSSLKPESQEAVLTYQVEDQPVGEVVTSVLSDLNRVCRLGPLDESEEFVGVNLRPATRALAATDPSGMNLVRLNRMVIEDALAGSLVPTSGMNPMLFSAVDFLGNRNVALLIGTVLAAGVLLRQRRWSLGKLAEKISPALETAGVIILITSAGGAFGLMLRSAGVGDAVKMVAEGRDINLILLSWLVASVIRVAQGSATVSMLTAAAMLAPLLGPDLPYHPVYVFMAIGFGALNLSWMNDSGFWVVCKLSGFTEKETLKSWTVIATTNSFVGMFTCLILSKIIPGI